MIALVGGRVLAPSGELGPYTLLLDGPVVTGLFPPDAPLPAGATAVDVDGCVVAPGFIDTHVHGALGRNFMEAAPDAVQAIGRHLAAGGVTAYLATTTSAPEADLVRVLGDLQGDVSGPEMVGIHLEGPFVNPRFSGTHAAQAVRVPTGEELERLWAAGAGRLRVVTLAPEIPGGAEAVRFFASRGAQVSLGHSGATYAEARMALAAGVRRCTHLFNALPTIHHRDPGPVTAVLEDPTAFVELVVDGQHVHPAVVALAVRQTGPDRVILISDGVDVAGQGDGTFTRWEGTRVIVRDGQARTQAGSLAGSTLTMDQAVANMVNLVGIPLPAALRMASANPARAIGLEQRKGSLLPGMDADVVVMGPDLRVRMTIARGQTIYDANRR